MKNVITQILCLTFCWAVSGQKVQTITNESWVSNNWQNSVKQNFTYDGNGYQISNFHQTWDTGSSSWQNLVLISFINNSNGTTNLYTYQDWNNVTNAWDNSTQVYFTYISNNVETAIYKIWDNNKWQNGIKLSYTYDGNGYLLTSLQQLWDESSNTWINFGQITNTNNANGTVQQNLSQTWDFSTNNWINSSRGVFTYISNKIETATYQNWVNNNWLNSNKENNTYDGNGYQLTNRTQNWSESSSSWVNKDLNSFTNNTNGTIHQILLQNWAIPSSSWVNSSRSTYDYTNPISVNKQINDQFRVFPNPCTNNLNIELVESAGVKYSIIDLQGKIVSSNILSNDTSIDISKLPAKSYFIIIEQNGKTGYHKFMKIN